MKFLLAISLLAVTSVAQEKFVCNEGTVEECPSKMCIYTLKGDCSVRGCATIDQCANKTNGECFKDGESEFCCCNDSRCATKNQASCSFEKAEATTEKPIILLAETKLKRDAELPTEAPVVEQKVEEEEPIALKQVAPVVQAGQDEQQPEPITEQAVAAPVEKLKMAEEFVFNNVTTKQPEQHVVSVTEAVKVEEVKTTVAPAVPLVTTEAVKVTTEAPTTAKITTQPPTTTAAPTTTVVITTPEPTTTEKPTTTTTSTTTTTVSTTTTEVETMTAAAPAPKPKVLLVAPPAFGKMEPVEEKKKTPVQSVVPAGPPRMGVAEILETGQRTAPIIDEPIRGQLETVTHIAPMTSSALNREVEEQKPALVPWWSASILGFIVVVVAAWVVITYLKKKRARQSSSSPNRRPEQKKTDALVDPLLLEKTVDETVDSSKSEETTGLNKY